MIKLTAKAIRLLMFDVSRRNRGLTHWLLVIRSIELGWSWIALEGGDSGFYPRIS